MSNNNITSLFVYVWCSIIITVTGLWIRLRKNDSSIPETDERFSSASKGSDFYRTSHDLLFSGYGWLFPRG
jgi:hypothetical protein